MLFVKNHTKHRKIIRVQILRDISGTRTVPVRVLSATPSALLHDRLIRLALAGPAWPGGEAGGGSHLQVLYRTRTAA